jgi:AbrB family looped-hinge helix DNA binding protein
MPQTIAITRQWQIHIPKSIRQVIDMKKPSMAEIKVENDTIIITPKKSGILELAGKYSKYAKGKNIDLDNIRDLIDYSDL